nr:hypothetical protein [Escherichia coli]
MPQSVERAAQWLRDSQLLLHLSREVPKGATVEALLARQQRPSFRQQRQPVQLYFSGWSHLPGR